MTINSLTTECAVYMLNLVESGLSDLLIFPHGELFRVKEDVSTVRATDSSPLQCYADYHLSGPSNPCRCNRNFDGRKA